MPDLFPAAPRRAPIKRMHVADAGCDAIKFKCRCGHDTGWIIWNRREITVSEAKRGLPCPKCNAQGGVDG